MSQLEGSGHEPVVVARSRGVDLLTGAGLDAALEGVEAVIDVSNLNTSSAGKSVAFFGTATSSLLAAAARVGVRHHVVLSIVNSDEVDFGYYQGKRRQEALVAAGLVPWSVLRSTQFHELVEEFVGRARGGVAPVPRMRSAPVAANEVAAALVALALGQPVGRAPDLGGPEVHLLPDLARQLVQFRGLRTKVLPMRFPGPVGRQMLEGALLPGPSARRGTQTFAEWLAS